MAQESLLITMLADGTFHVKETGETDPGDPGVDQSVQDPDELMQIVQQWVSQEGSEGDSSFGDSTMGEDDPSDGGSPSAPPPPTKAAWNAEASTRDPSSGMRK